MLIPNNEVKALLKEAIVEVIEERRELIQDFLEKIFEDIALTCEIEEGEFTESVTREEVFKLFPNTP